MMTIVIDGLIFKAYDSMYYVSEYGDVYSTYSRKILKPHIDLDGYLRVDIHSKHMKIHKLVYLTWVSRDLCGLQINHKDDNKWNNHYSNLYLGTQKENIQDCINNGHREGNINHLTVFDKNTNQTLSFCPAKEFIDYCGHPSRSGSVKKFFDKNWFKIRYDIISYSKGKCND